MNEKTEPEKEYPYIDRPMWLYSRSSDKKISTLMQQMHELLEEAQRRSYTVDVYKRQVFQLRYDKHKYLLELPLSDKG